MIISRGLSCWQHAHARGIEDEGFDLRFGAVSGDFLAVKQESDSGGVADSSDDFAGGADGGVGGSDQGFLVDILAVGKDGDPGSFRGADDQRERGRGWLRRFRNRLSEGANGHIVLVVVTASATVTLAGIDGGSLGR